MRAQERHVSEGMGGNVTCGHRPLQRGLDKRLQPFRIMEGF